MASEEEKKKMVFGVTTVKFKTRQRNSYTNSFVK